MSHNIFDFLHRGEEVDDEVELFADFVVLMTHIYLLEHLAYFLACATCLLVRVVGLRGVQLVFFLLQFSYRLVTIDSIEVLLTKLEVLGKVLTPGTHLISVIVGAALLFIGMVLPDEAERLLQQHPLLQLLIDHELRRYQVHQAQKDALLLICLAGRVDLRFLCENLLVARRFLFLGRRLLLIGQSEDLLRGQAAKSCCDLFNCR